MGTHNYTQPLVGEERTVETADGTRLRTLSIGSGDHTVMLAHGYAGAAEAWNLVAPMLVDAGVRVIAFDQRGHGQSTVGRDGVGTAQMASDYGAVLTAYDANDVTLMTHSMGGFLGIAFLLDGDESATTRVDSLVLMGTFAGDVSLSNPQNRLQIPLIKTGVLQRLVRFGPVAKAFTKSLVGDHFDDQMVDAFIPTFLEADHPQLIPILQAMVEENRYGRLSEIELPCTVMVGDKDKTTPPFHTADLHSGIAGSKLVTLPGVGHGVNWEAPDAIVAEVMSLIERAAT